MHVMESTELLRSVKPWKSGATPDRLEESLRGLIYAAKVRELRHWIIMFSGGKDSTTALILALEAAKRCGLVERIDIVYGDTGTEIPTLREHALEFLSQLDSEQLPIHVHVVNPQHQESFWVLVIGKGYPPPRQHFRWCTSKLKIKPAEKVLGNIPRNAKTAIITGVRFGESDVRDGRLKLSCSRGGECGQGMWYERTDRLNAYYLGPILAWRECSVWDFLDFVAPDWGYKTSALRPMYLGSNTRFGCWTCTVVNHDRTMKKIVETDEGKKYRPLYDFRNWLSEYTKQEKTRVKRANGISGRLTLASRRKILKELKNAEKALGSPLLTKEDIAAIRALWKDPKYGDAYL